MMRVGMARLGRVVAVFLAALFASSAVRAAGETRFALENGLRVILRPVDGADEAVVLVCYDFGENADPEGKSGLAHFIEHLYFTAGAGKTPVRTFDEIVSAYQGLFNAQTGEDYTVFATVVPAGELENELTDAASRMDGLKITSADVDRERPRIVLELRNMYGNVSGLSALNRAREAVRPSLPGSQKGGMIEVIEALTLEELKDAAEKWYKPVNARLVITGALDAERTKKRVEELFGGIQAGEKPQTHERSFVERPERVVVQGNEPGAPGIVVLAYPCPPAGQEHAAAASLLVARLMAKAQAAGEFTGQFPPPVFHPVLDDPYLLYVGARMKPNETPEEAVKRLDDRVAAAFDGAVQAGERTNVRNGAGMFLGFVDPPAGLPGQGLYGLAFSLARRAQVGIDAGEVSKRLDEIDEAGMAAARDACFNAAKRAAVVILPMPTPPEEVGPGVEEGGAGGAGGGIGG